MKKNFLAIRISSSGNHFLGKCGMWTEVDYYLVGVPEQEI